MTEEKQIVWLPMHITDWWMAANRMSAHEFKAMTIALCDYAIDGERPTFTNKSALRLLERFDHEINRMKNRKKQASDAAITSWKNRNKNKGNEMQQHMQPHMKPHMQPTTTTTTTTIPTTTTTEVSGMLTHASSSASDDGTTDTASRRKKPASKGTRLPEEWYPDTQGMAYADQRGLSPEETATEVERFRNYWHAKSGKDATKMKWDATWKNWVLRSVEMKGKNNDKRNTRNGNRPVEMSETEFLEMVARGVMRGAEGAGGQGIPPRD